MRIKNIHLQAIKVNSYTKFILFLIIILLINIIVNQLYLKFDLTKDKNLSLSKASKKIVRELTEPMIVKVFFSKELPAPYNTYERYIRDLLSEYKANSKNNNFRYEIIDLKKYPDMPTEYGIYPVQLQVIEKDQVQFKRAYIGMVILHGDLIERIPQITSTEGLEYKITSIIKKMTEKIDKLLHITNKIQVYLFASSNIPLDGINELNSKVKEKIELANKKLFNKLEYFYMNTTVDTNAIEIANKYNIPKLNWNAITERTGRVIPAGEGYLGVLVVYEDNYQIINLLGRGIFGNYMIVGIEELENNIQAIIDNLLGINPKIGYITGHDEPVEWNIPAQFGGQQDENSISKIADMIRQNYQMESINLNQKKIPLDISALLIVDPKKKFTDYELYQIDQFIMSGKPVAFFVSGLNFVRPEENLPGPYGNQPPQGVELSTGLEYLLSHYGVKLNNNLILDNHSYKQQIPAEYGGGERQIYYAPIIDQENIYNKHPITKKIKGIILLTASSIDPINDVIKENKLNFIPLIKTSKESWQQGPGVILNPYYFYLPDKSQLTQFTVAAIVEGKLKSYFNNKEIPNEPFTNEGAAKQQTDKSKTSLFDSKKPDFISESKEPTKSRFIIISCPALVKNNLIDNQGTSPNAVFVRNIIDWLLNDAGFMEIRSKGLSYNPPKKLNEYIKGFVKWFNIIGAPIIILIVGLILWRNDILRRKAIKQNFSK